MTPDFLNPWFANPLHLYWFFPLAAHAIWMSLRLEALSRARRIWATGLRITLIALICLSISGLRLQKISKELTVFFVLDQSDSVPQGQREFAEVYIQKSLEEMGPDDRAGIIVFGSEAALEQSPAAKLDFLQPESIIPHEGTNIADALQLAMACFVGGGQKRIVLLSDGNQNIGSAADVATAARGSDVVIDVLPLKYDNRNDLVVDKVMVDSRVSLEEPFGLRVIATANETGRAKLSIHQDGVLVQQEDVELIGGRKTLLEVQTEVKTSGFHTFEVQIDAPGDIIPENNKGFAFTYGEGEPHVLLVEGDPQPTKTLPAMLYAEKIAVDIIGPSQFPVSLRELQAYDAVIFNNVPAFSLSGLQLEIIASAVHDFGMGFMMIGGENSFGPGGYNDSPIEEILPVNMELKNEKILPQGALVPVIHTVEIPQGQMWGEKVIEAALNVLSPQDLMGVLYYDYGLGGPAWLFKLQPVTGKSMMRKRLKQVQPGDMPSFDNTLELAYKSLSKSTASVKHIVIISDGDPATPNYNLASRIKAEKISISTVCINPHSQRDAVTMEQLAKSGGGNFYYPKNYNELPQIFIREATTVRKSLIIEKPFVPVVSGYSPILGGIGDGYPQLKGYVGTTAKELADVPLRSPDTGPLLAHWRHGVGKTIAFTSDAKERWASDWLQWPQFGKFWTQAVRWMIRPPFNPNYQVQTEIDGSAGKIIIDAVNDKGDFRNFLQMNGRVVSPEMDAQEVDFRQTSPGRYEADFDVEDTGTYMFSVESIGTDSEEEVSTDLVTGGTAVSYSPEYRNARSNQALLYGLSDMTRGRNLDPQAPANAFERNLQTSAEATPLWPYLIFAGLFVFLADIFARRVLIGFPELKTGGAVAWNWTAQHVFRRRFGRDTEASTEDLLKVKASSRKTKKVDEAKREDFLSSLKKVKVDQSPVEPRKKPPIPTGKVAPKKSAPKAPPGEAPRLTEQLLKKRTEVRRKYERNDD